MKSKEQLIKEYLKEPIKVGDKIYVRGLGSQNKDSWITSTEVIKIEGDDYYYRQHGYVELQKANIKDIKKYTNHIGYNPFPEKHWDSSIKFISFSLGSILNTCGFERRKNIFKTESFGEIEVPELCWNPIIIDLDGKEVEYQRGFVWSLKEKQLLIDSIYNNIEIGKIIVRLRSYSYVEKKIKQQGKIRNLGFKDIVDGKQRLNSIFGFINNEFPDLNGMFYKDLSDIAKHRFDNFSAVSYGELGENASDKDVKSVFLNINFAGIPMSQEHIDFVKSINI